MIDSVEMTVLSFCLSGAIAQLGERIAGSDEVRGSIPLGSTIINNQTTSLDVVFCLLWWSFPRGRTRVQSARTE